MGLQGDAVGQPGAAPGARPEREGDVAKPQGAPSFRKKSMQRSATKAFSELANFMLSPRHEDHVKVSLCAAASQKDKRDDKTRNRHGWGFFFDLAEEGKYEDNAYFEGQEEGGEQGGGDGDGEE